MFGRFAILLKTLLVNASILLVTLIFIDLASYMLLPIEINRTFDDYRTPTRGAIGGRGDYPKGYFASHPTRGFDIRPGARAEHSVDGVTYPIWSNSLGCFDREWGRIPANYYYFAGDSSTWGYTPFEEKFATIFEERSGITSLKCGVTHTGQRHQFEKLLEIIQIIRSLPKHVVVGYSYNDVANDYAHPHSTVVDEWLVDDVFVDASDYSLVRTDRDWIEKKVSERVANTNHGSLWTSVKKSLRRYSISAQVTGGAFRALSAVAGIGTIKHSDDFFYKGRLLRNFYYVGNMYYLRGGKYRFGETQFSAANRQILLSWQAHARENNYKLTFLLIPVRDYHRSTDFYAELKQFFEAHGTDYIDLSDEFRAARVGADQVYWRIDGHMSPSGNRLVAEMLLKRLVDKTR